MNKEQIRKLLKIGIIVTAILLLFEIIFSIGPVNDFFTSLILKYGDGPWIGIVIWLIMFLQVTILNIPAYVILSASVSVGIETLSFSYFCIVISAYMAGCLLAYGIGRKFGIKATKWVAGNEEEFNKWSSFLNKKGKWYYFLTILFPLFPDDLLCIVAGSTKLNFWFYTIANFIGRSIGLITMLLVLELIGSLSASFPFMIIVWAIALLAQIIALVVINKRR